MSLIPILLLAMTSIMTTRNQQDPPEQLNVRKIETDAPVSPEKAGELLEAQTSRNLVRQLNWPAYDYRPAVVFRIGYTDDAILIKYYVREKHIKATVTETNGPVHTDSCVEFFLSLDEKGYYNFEFNCIGVKHVAFGPDRHHRENIDPAVLEQIEITSTLGDQPFEEKTGDFRWELTAVIPYTCLIHHNINSLKGKKATANFYKCGDDTTRPHYVTWSPIGTENPDYHQPAYFGKLSFK